jgi:hypothetical protein
MMGMSPAAARLHQTDRISDCRRPSQGLHQEDHVAAQGLDVERWQFDVSRQSTSVALVLTCAGPNLREEREIQKLKTGSRQRELRSWVGQPIYASHLEAH